MAQCHATPALPCTYTQTLKQASEHAVKSAAHHCQLDDGSIDGRVDESRGPRLTLRISRYVSRSEKSHSLAVPLQGSRHIYTASACLPRNFPPAISHYFSTTFALHEVLRFSTGWQLEGDSYLFEAELANSQLPCSLQKSHSQGWICFRAHQEDPCTFPRRCWPWNPITER